MTEQEWAARLRDARRRGGLTSSAIRRERLEANATDDLAAFDPGPAAGPHDHWIDAWRRRRVRVETDRGAGRRP
jgi:hypothetical protein